MAEVGSNTAEHEKQLCKDAACSDKGLTCKSARFACKAAADAACAAVSSLLAFSSRSKHPVRAVISRACLSIAQCIQA